MPVYSYLCPNCGSEADHVVPYEKREWGQECERCGALAQYRISAPTLGRERLTAANKPIWDERQVTDKHGKHWREEGTTGKPGGAGKKLFFHD